MSKIIGEIQKNSREKIIASINDFKGNTFVDLRVHYEDDSGEYKPTKKGLAVSEKNIDGVIKLLNNSKQELLNGRES
jgi:hypothetical protein